VADTKTTIGSAYTFAATGRIKKIMVTGYQGVTDKAESGVLTLNFKTLTGPFEFACVASAGEITVGGKRNPQVIDVDLPVKNGEVVTVSLTTAEALEDCVVSLLFIE